MPRYTRTKENLESHLSNKNISTNKHPDQNIRKQQKKICKGTDGWHESHKWSMPYSYGEFGSRGSYYSNNGLKKYFSLYGYEQYCVRCNHIRSYPNPAPVFWRGLRVNKQSKNLFDPFDKDIFEYFRAQDQEFTEEWIHSSSTKYTKYMYNRNQWRRILKKRSVPIVDPSWGKAFLKRYSPEWKKEIDLDNLVNPPDLKS